MTTDAASNLTRHIVHKCTFGLHRHKILVKYLEEDISFGRNDKVGRAVVFNRHHASLDFQAEVGILGDAGILLVVLIPAPVAARRP